MGFFLSKLLPLFIYPVGSSIVLSLLGMVMLWRRQRLPALSFFSGAILILTIASLPWVANLLGRSLEYQYMPNPELPQAEAIVVLGGGTKAQIYPRPWLEVAEAGDRLIYGAKLWREQKAPILILSGGRSSIYGEGGRAESEDMAELAQVLGVNQNAICQDRDSLNTRENAVNVQKILNQKQINRILLVTSAMHMPRAMAIFKKLGIEAIAAPTDFQIVENSHLGIFDFLPDANALQYNTNALKEFLGMLAYRWRGWV